MASRTTPKIDAIGSAFIIKMPRGFAGAEQEVRAVFPDAVWTQDHQGWLVSATKVNENKIRRTWAGAKFFGSPDLVPEHPEIQQVIDPRLYKFQNTGVAFLMKREGAILADEMGLGKTVQSIIALDQLAENGYGRYLVVVPNTLKENWRDEINDWYGWEVPIFIIEGTREQRQAIIWEVAQTPFCWAIINWEALRLHTESGKNTDRMLCQIRWDAVIADEAHRAKNRKAKQTMALKKIPAVRRWALTGTPIMNRPDEIWSILNWLYPSQYPSYWRFFDRYVDYTETYFGKQINGAKHTKELGEMLRPVMMRRLKEDVFPDMPPKVYRNIYVRLTPAQRRAYDELVEHLITQLEDGEIVAVTAIIAQLVRLKQISISLGLLSEGVHDSSKIDTLMDLIDDMGDEKMVVFSQFSTAIGLVHERLVHAKIPHVVLTGKAALLVEADGTRRKMTRGDIIKRFQKDPRYRVFIGTTQAGGVGITLTAASTIVFMDKMWNPAMNSQAEDRLHRIGQTKSVQVISLIAKDTVEESIEKMLANKTLMVNEILSRAERRGKKRLVDAVRTLVR